MARRSNKYWRLWVRAAAAIFAAILAPPSFAQPGTDDTQTESNDQDPTQDITALRMQFEFEGLNDLPVYLIAPPNFSDESRKVIIYFVGGGQEEEHAFAALNSRVAREAVRRGYVFVAPAAACYECTFVAKGEEYFPRLFSLLRDIIPMSEDRFHLMGFSNGGRSSFHIATRHPEEVASITAYPGYLRNQKYELLERLSDICVTMYVGRNDEGFLRRHKRTVRELEKLGRPVEHKIFRGEGHSIDPLWTEEGANTLLDGIENGLGCPQPN